MPNAAPIDDDELMSRIKLLMPLRNERLVQRLAGGAGDGGAEAAGRASWTAGARATSARSRTRATRSAVRLAYYRRILAPSCATVAAARQSVARSGSRGSASSSFDHFHCEFMTKRQVEAIFGVKLQRVVELRSGRERLAAVSMKAATVPPGFAYASGLRAETPDQPHRHNVFKPLGSAAGRRADGRGVDVDGDALRRDGRPGAVAEPERCAQLAAGGRRRQRAAHRDLRHAGGDGRGAEPGHLLRAGRRDGPVLRRRLAAQLRGQQHGGGVRRGGEAADGARVRRRPRRRQRDGAARIVPDDVRGDGQPDVPPRRRPVRLGPDDGGALRFRAAGGVAGAVAPGRVARARRLRDRRRSAWTYARVYFLQTYFTFDSITLTPALAGNPQTGKLPQYDPKYLIMQVTPGRTQIPSDYRSMYGVPSDQPGSINGKIAQGVIEWPITPPPAPPGNNSQARVALGGFGQGYNRRDLPVFFSRINGGDSTTQLNVDYIGLAPELGAPGESQLDIQMVMGVASPSIYSVFWVYNESDSFSEACPTSSTRC